MYDDRRFDAFDPIAQREYFEGMLGRRFVAFLIDAVVVFIPVVLASILIFLFGFITLGLGWYLFALLGPANVVWALIYAAVTLGGSCSATLGMRAMGIEMRQMDGGVMSPLLAIVSLVLFWVSMSMLTPLVAIVGLLNSRKRLLHDLIIGTVVVNEESRAAYLRGDRREHGAVRGSARV